MKKLLFLFMLTLIFSCVSESNYQEVVEENKALKAEIEDVRSELEGIKFGIPTLLREARNSFELNDFLTAKQKIEELTDFHPNASETAEARKMLPAIEEEFQWTKAKTSKDLFTIEEYLTNYPKGKYYKEAYREKKKLTVKMDEIAYEDAKSQNTVDGYNAYLENHPEGKYRRRVRAKLAGSRKVSESNAYVSTQSSEENDYESAKRKKSSRVWEKFLKNHPDHWDKSDIEKRIISLKIDEIMNDRNTGELPSFAQTSTAYSSTSNVTIENDTGYRLTVRYSGPSVKEIVISRGSSETTSLSSGSYKIAASANGLHYAGRESLSGNYSSKYYISTSRY